MNEFSRVETEALALPREERVRLALKLFESIEANTGSNPPQVEQTSLEETHRRNDTSIPINEKIIAAEQIFAEMRQEDA